MKKIISTILVCALLVASIFTVASCDLLGKNISGTYEGSVEVNVLVTKVSLTLTYEFKGNEVTVKSTASASGLGSVSSESVTATYEIGEDEDGNKTITFNYGDSEKVDGAAEGGVALPFEKGRTDDGVSYIEIAGVRYNKVK